MSTRSLEVVRAGALTTVQDHGRPGHAHLGVPRSGALDAPAHDLANRLVGNAPTAATLETTLTGVAVRLAHAAPVAVTGAFCPVLLEGRPVAWGAAVLARAGQVVEVGTAYDGLRSYLAIGGGVAVEPVLGSRSADLLSGLGPAPLAEGDVLPLGVPMGRPSPVEVVPVRRRHEITVRPGPREDRLADVGALAATYDVGSSSDRVGLRLHGIPLERAGEEEQASEGMVLGAVQLPPDGQPVVFLHDHPTTGGYPVVGVVAAADLAVCAQLRPGERVRLRVAPRR